MLWYFLFFFLSGFCSVLYELVWLRLSMAQFGVTTAMVSIVLSVFMAGLGLGSWASGRWLRPEHESSFPALRLYALTELLIGVSGIVVPHELLWGRGVLEHAGMSSSLAYYVVAGLWVALTLLPWCTLMGATLPIGMRAIAETIPARIPPLVQLSLYSQRRWCGRRHGVAAVADRTARLSRNPEGRDRVQLPDRRFGVWAVKFCEGDRRAERAFRTIRLRPPRGLSVWATTGFSAFCSSAA